MRKPNLRSHTHQYSSSFTTTTTENKKSKCSTDSHSKWESESSWRLSSTDQAKCNISEIVSKEEATLQFLPNPETCPLFPVRGWIHATVILHDLVNAWNTYTVWIWSDKIKNLQENTTWNFTFISYDTHMTLKFYKTRSPKLVRKCKKLNGGHHHTNLEIAVSWIGQSWSFYQPDRL